MKIIKYIFLFIVLAAIALTVFIATQNSNYSISKTTEIKLPKTTVFNYLNDLKNFEQWQVINENVNAFKFDSISKGDNAIIYWKNNSLKNLHVYPSDSLVQIFNQDENEKNLKWILKSTQKGTQLTLTEKGKMDFITKFKAFFSGGIENILGPNMKKNLKSFNHHIIKEYEKFSVKNEGIVLIRETFYIKQQVHSKIEDLGNEIFKSMKNMKIFCEQNDLKIAGAPFTIFKNLNFNSGIVNYSVCLPITTEIFTNVDSDITSGKLESFYAYKTVLTGDYSHSDKAWNENRKEITKNKLTQNYQVKPISIYKNSTLETNKPSEWITELLTPVNESVIYIPETQNDTIQ